MWDLFKFAFDAILPIILLIVLGYVLKRLHFFTPEFLKIGNKFVFNVALPVLLFYNVYSIESFADIEWSSVIYSEICIVALFLLGWAYVHFFIKDPRQKGVILQCVFRSNFSIIGLPLAASLGGEVGEGIAAILSAFSIPTYNILAVIALTMFIKNEDGKSIPIKTTLKKIVTNPLIIGVVAGMVVLGFRSLIPVDSNTGELVFSLERDVSFIFEAVVNLSKIASPFSLIVLGGQFEFASVKGLYKQILTGTIGRTVVVPLVCIGLAVILSTYTDLFEFDKTIYPSFIALFGSPVAVSSAIMAQEMDNDGELAGQLVVWTSIASIFTLFIMVITLRSIGLL